MSERMDALARAIRAWLEFAAGGTESRAAFLERHADLRELLEPMLDGAVDEVPEAARELGDYRLVRELGRGGMGVVYEAQQLSLPRRVALKVLGAHLTLRPEAVARFRAEAVTAARLEHPGIVRILAQGGVAEAHFFAMELVQGASLQAVIELLREAGAARLDGSSLWTAVAAATARAFPGAQVAVPARARHSHCEASVDLILQVADALDHGHQQGVIHRDVKPANVLVRADGSAVLTDFGLARDQDLPGLTVSGTFAGTPHYTSPEQASGRRQALDARTDVWALGATLYELATLQRPFPGDTAQEVLAAIQTQEPRNPELLDGHVPPDLAAVILKALEKDGRRRYQSAAAFASDLRAFLAHRPVVARRASALERVRRWRRREPVKAAVVAVLAVAAPLLTGAAGYLWARRDEIRAGQTQLLARQVQEAVDQGFLDFSLEKPSCGLEQFEAALALDPRCAEAVFGLVQAVMKRQGPEAALARLDAEYAGSVAPTIRDRLRCMLLYSSRRDDAEAIYHRLPDPRTDLELFVHGIINRDQDIHAGTELLEYVERAALAADRPRLWIHVHWAVFADTAGDAASCRRCAANLLLNWPDEPIAVYSACIALRGVQPEQAMKLVDSALVAHPDLGLLHCARGMALRARGQHRTAIDCFERAIALSPPMAFLNYSLGAASYDAGDFEGAIGSFIAARDISPRMVDAWVGLGMALRRAGRINDALEALLQARQLQPRHFTGRFQLGQIFMLLDRVAEGVAEFRASAEMTPKDPNKWHHLASALFRADDDAGAIESLRLAVAAMPTSNRAHEFLVLGLRNAGQHAESRKALDNWVETLPKSLDGWLQLGRHCTDPERPDQHDAPAAIWAARRAIALSQEQSAAAWYVLGAGEALLGHAEPARQALGRSLRIAAAPLAEPERSRCERLLREIGPSSEGR